VAGSCEHGDEPSGSGATEFTGSTLKKHRRVASNCSLSYPGSGCFPHFKQRRRKCVCSEGFVTVGKEVMPFCEE
jgi:hypothetical protein